MKLTFTVFLIIGAVLLLAAVVVLVVMIYRYITGMRAQGFFGGKKKLEKE
ncbi:MAG: hypothetical protein JEZ04_07640 [Spirochaetales bacterium]|nr:hypothetical protein [Spirochaetales bacterium]